MFQLAIGCSSGILFGCELTPHKSIGNNFPSFPLPELYLEADVDKCKIEARKIEKIAFSEGDMMLVMLVMVEKKNDEIFKLVGDFMSKIWNYAGIVYGHINDVILDVIGLIVSCYQLLLCSV